MVSPPDPQSIFDDWPEDEAPEATAVPSPPAKKSGGGKKKKRPRKRKKPAPPPIEISFEEPEVIEADIPWEPDLPSAMGELFGESAVQHGLPAEHEFQESLSSGDIRKMASLVAKRGDDLSSRDLQDIGLAMTTTLRDEGYSESLSVEGAILDAIGRAGERFPEDPADGWTPLEMFQHVPSRNALESLRHGIGQHKTERTISQQMLEAGSMFQDPDMSQFDPEPSYRHGEHLESLGEAARENRALGDAAVRGEDVGFDSGFLMGGGVPEPADTPGGIPGEIPGVMAGPPKPDLPELDPDGNPLQVRGMWDVRQDYDRLRGKWVATAQGGSRAPGVPGKLLEWSDERGVWGPIRNRAVVPEKPTEKTPPGFWSRAWKEAGNTVQGLMNLVAGGFAASIVDSKRSSMETPPTTKSLYEASKNPAFSPDGVGSAYDLSRGIEPRGGRPNDNIAMIATMLDSDPGHIPGERVEPSARVGISLAEAKDAGKVFETSSLHEMTTGIEAIRSIARRHNKPGIEVLLQLARDPHPYVQSDEWDTRFARSLLGESALVADALMDESQGKSNAVIGGTTLGKSHSDTGKTAAQTFEYLSRKVNSKGARRLAMIQENFASRVALGTLADRTRLDAVIQNLGFSPDDPLPGGSTAKEQYLKMVAHFPGNFIGGIFRTFKGTVGGLVDHQIGLGMLPFSGGGLDPSGKLIPMDLAEIIDPGAEGRTSWKTEPVLNSLNLALVGGAIRGASPKVIEVTKATAEHGPRALREIVRNELRKSFGLKPNPGVFDESGGWLAGEPRGGPAPRTGVPWAPRPGETLPVTVEGEFARYKGAGPFDDIVDVESGVPHPNDPTVVLKVIDEGKLDSLRKDVSQHVDSLALRDLDRATRSEPAPAPLLLAETAGSSMPPIEADSRFGTVGTAVAEEVFQEGVRRKTHSEKVSQAVDEGNTVVDGAGLVPYSPEAAKLQPDLYSVVQTPTPATVTRRFAERLSKRENVQPNVVDRLNQIADFQAQVSKRATGIALSAESLFSGTLPGRVAGAMGVKEIDWSSGIKSSEVWDDATQSFVKVEVGDRFATLETAEEWGAAMQGLVDLAEQSGFVSGVFIDGTGKTFSDYLKNSDDMRRRAERELEPDAEKIASTVVDVTERAFDRSGQPVFKSDDILVSSARRSLDTAEIGIALDLGIPPSADLRLRSAVDLWNDYDARTTLLDNYRTAFTRKRRAAELAARGVISPELYAIVGGGSFNPFQIAFYRASARESSDFGLTPDRLTAMEAEVFSALGIPQVEKFSLAARRMTAEAMSNAGETLPEFYHYSGLPYEEAESLLESARKKSRLYGGVLPKGKPSYMHKHIRRPEPKPTELAMPEEDYWASHRGNLENRLNDFIRSTPEGRLKDMEALGLDVIVDSVTNPIGAVVGSADAVLGVITDQLLKPSSGQWGPHLAHALAKYLVSPSRLIGPEGLIEAGKQTGTKKTRLNLAANRLKPLLKTNPDALIEFSEADLIGSMEAVESAMNKGAMFTDMAGVGASAARAADMNRALQKMRAMEDFTFRTKNGMEYKFSDWIKSEVRVGTEWMDAHVFSTRARRGEFGLNPHANITGQQFNARDGVSYGDIPEQIRAFMIAGNKLHVYTQKDITKLTSEIVAGLDALELMPLEGRIVARPYFNVGQTLKNVMGHVTEAYDPVVAMTTWAEMAQRLKEAGGDKAAEASLLIAFENLDKMIGNALIDVSPQEYFASEKRVPRASEVVKDMQEAVKDAEAARGRGERRGPASTIDVENSTEIAINKLTQSTRRSRMMDHVLEAYPGGSSITHETLTELAKKHDVPIVAILERNSDRLPLPSLPEFRDGAKFVFSEKGNLEVPTSLESKIRAGYFDYAYGQLKTIQQLSGILADLRYMKWLRDIGALRHVDEVKNPKITPPSEAANYVIPGSRTHTEGFLPPKIRSGDKERVALGFLDDAKFRINNRFNDFFVMRQAVQESMNSNLQRLNRGLKLGLVADAFMTAPVNMMSNQFMFGLYAADSAGRPVPFTGRRLIQVIADMSRALKGGKIDPLLLQGLEQGLEEAGYLQTEVAINDRLEMLELEKDFLLQVQENGLFAIAEKIAKGDAPSPDDIKALQWLAESMMGGEAAERIGKNAFERMPRSNSLVLEGGTRPSNVGADVLGAGMSGAESVMRGLAGTDSLQRVAFFYELVLDYGHSVPEAVKIARKYMLDYSNAPHAVDVVSRNTAIMGEKFIRFMWTSAVLTPEAMARNPLMFSILGYIAQTANQAHQALMDMSEEEQRGYARELGFLPMGGEVADAPTGRANMTQRIMGIEGWAGFEGMGDVTLQPLGMNLQQTDPLFSPRRYDEFKGLSNEAWYDMDIGDVRWRPDYWKLIEGGIAREIIEDINRAKGGSKHSTDRLPNTEWGDTWTYLAIVGGKIIPRFAKNIAAGLDPYTDAWDLDKKNLVFKPQGRTLYDYPVRGALVRARDMRLSQLYAMRAEMRVIKQMMEDWDLSLVDGSRDVDFKKYTDSSEQLAALKERLAEISAPGRWQSGDFKRLLKKEVELDIEMLELELEMLRLEGELRRGREAVERMMEEDSLEEEAGDWLHNPPGRIQ